MTKREWGPQPKPPSPLFCLFFSRHADALDPRMANEVLGVIADLAKSGQTMIVVTHAMGFARRVAHPVHVMHAGRVAEAGPPGQVFTAPAHEATRAFLSEIGPAEAKGD